MTQVWQPNYSTNAGQSYQNLICSQYRLAQKATVLGCTSCGLMSSTDPCRYCGKIIEHPRKPGIVDPEISEHVGLLVAQLQDANQRILDLEVTRDLLEARLTAEIAKTQAICRAAAQTPVVVPDAPQEAFPANALRWSV